MKTLCILMVWYCILISGVAPELYAMTIQSNDAVTAADDARSAAISKRMARISINITPSQIQAALGSAEAQAFMKTNILCGGYYSSPGTSNNQYSSFFGNIENFLVELVEFFLFLAMLSYLVGYEEWLPWEEEDDEDD